jgi:hypothetical protein
MTDVTPTSLPAAAAAGFVPEVAVRPSGWTGGRIAAMVAGGLLVVVSLGLLVGAGFGLWADLTQRDGGYVTTSVHTFSTSGAALSTEPTELGTAGFGWLYAPGLLDEVRFRVTPVSSDRSLFVGVGPSADVDRYLAGVKRTIISDFWGNGVEAIDGSKPGSPPGTQDFWVASSSGSGARTLVWDPADGSWSVVVMNADGRPGIDVGADLGARMPALRWIAFGSLALGAAFMAGGVLLIVGAMRRRRASRLEAK